MTRQLERMEYVPRFSGSGCQCVVLLVEALPNTLSIAATKLDLDGGKVGGESTVGGCGWIVRRMR